MSTYSPKNVDICETVMPVVKKKSIAKRPAGKKKALPKQLKQMTVLVKKIHKEQGLSGPELMKAAGKAYRVQKRSTSARSKKRTCKSKAKKSRAKR